MGTITITCKSANFNITSMNNSLSGDYVAIEENKPVDNRKGRLIREENEDDASEDERVDMSAITGQKELEERREKFYSVQGHGKYSRKIPKIIGTSVRLSKMYSRARTFFPVCHVNSRQRQIKLNHATVHDLNQTIYNSCFMNVD